LLATASTDVSLVSVLRGAPDLAPKPLVQRLREIQAANGRLDITNARLQQGDIVAADSFNRLSDGAKVTMRTAAQPTNSPQPSK